MKATDTKSTVLLHHHLKTLLWAIAETMIE